MKKKISRSLGEIIFSKSHKQAWYLCLKYQGEFMYNEPGTGEIEFRFLNNLFVPDCLVQWNEFNFAPVEVRYGVF